jgi:tetratricopeptide (TPR) repeat protein
MEGLGARIRKRRKELNFTQSDVAGNVMSIAKLSNIETGKVTPDMVTLKYLQERLHLPDLNTDEFSREKISFIMEQAMTYVHSGLKAQALEKLNEAGDKAYRSLLLSTWVEAKEQIILMQIGEGLYDEASRQIKQIENYFRDTEDGLGTIRCLRKRGYISYQQKNFKHSIQYYKQALELADEGDKDTKGEIYYNLAAVYFEIHDLDLSSLYCDKALKECDNSSEDYKVYMLQGMILQRAGMYQLAEEKLRIAKKMAIKTKNHSGLAKSWHNLGQLEMDLGNFPEALQSFQLSIELKDQLQDFRGIARTKCYLSLLNAKQGNYELAEKEGLEAIKILADLGHDLDTLNALECLAEVYIINEKNFEAIESLQSAIEIATKYSLTSKLKALYETIANIHDERGEKDKCLFYLYKRMKLHKGRG